MKKIFFMMIVTAMLFACKKPAVSPGPVPPTPGEAAVTEIGQPAGAAVQKTIGANGGSLTSANGKVTLEIPAGALESNQTISLQPIETKAPLGLNGLSYRLMPQGLQLKKPASLTLKYSWKDMRGTSQEFVGLAAQQENKTWKKIAGGMLDTNSKEYKSYINSLVDYSFYTAYKLIDHKTETDTAIIHVATTEQVQFDAIWENDAAPGGLAIVTRAPYTKEWMINNVVNPPLENKFGYLSGKNGYYPSERDYVAPRRAPDPDTVAISVKIDLGSKGIMYLVRTIVIDDVNKLIINGKEYPDAIPSAFMYAPTGLLGLSLQQQMPNGKIANATLTLAGVFNPTPGNYHFNGSKEVSITAKNENGNEWSSERTNFNGVKEYTGQVDLTVTGTGNEIYVSGKITGSLFGKGNTINNGPVDITFSVRAQ